MESLVALARQAGISLVDLDAGISLAEVDQVVFTRHPGRHGVGYFVDLRCVSLRLDEAAEGFCVAHEAMFCLGRDGIGDSRTYLRYVRYSYRLP
jgi:hypothetical protein